MAVSVFTPVLRVIQSVHDLTREHKGIWSQLRVGISSLKDAMEMIQLDIATSQEQKLQELVYDIEDFIHGLATPRASGFVLTVLGSNPHEDELVTVGYLKERIKELPKWLESQRIVAKTDGSTTGANSESSSANHNIELVGNAKSEFEEVLSTVDHARLGVISIVGCRGLGKTALAWAVYRASVVPREFDCKAWVVASQYKNDAKGLLRKILEQIPKESAANSSSTLFQQTLKIEETIYAALHDKRYFFVIDDMLEEDMWDKVLSAFPDTAGSRIIVTTSIQSIATYIGRSNVHAHQWMQKLPLPLPLPHFREKNISGHRYIMPYLDMDSSRKLLHQNMGNPPGHIKHEDIILRKCDGLPLTLVSVANHLRPDLTDHNCNDVAQSLGSHIAGNGQAFGELKRTLIQCYDSLPGYQDRRCLLSVSMFPQGHQINMKSLLRKWIAEGLVAEQGQRNAMNIAYNSSNKFLDHSIIDPVLIGNNSDVKRSQVKGTMLEFLVYKSTCDTNFATIICQHGRLPTDKSHNPIRRLFVCVERIQEDLSFIRWLTLCTRVCFDLRKCSLLRVLDLQGCTGIVKEVMQNICKLLFLKYLSLRDSDAGEVPEEMQSLVNLETIDIRGTKVNVLPIKVAMMPGLVHLFGQFELVPPLPQKILERATRMLKGKEHKMVETPSKLETLAGINIQKEEKHFKQIMLHSRKLKKVKIWCNKAAAVELIPEEKFCGEEVLESLSVDCSESIRLLSHKFLELLSGSFAIKSLKLRGSLEGLPITPDDFMKIQKVIELQLSLTGLSWGALSVLQNMNRLLNLKLAEEHHDFGDESFIVQKDGFQNLRRLCIQAPRLPKVEFMEGAMPCLTSLELLQTEARTEVSTSQPGAPLPTGTVVEVTIPQPEVPPQVGVPLEIITHQLEALVLKDTISPTETTLQPGPGATSEITNAPPVAPVLTKETTERQPYLGVEGLTHLLRLNEVILHHSAPDGTMRVWKDAAKNHRNRPQVKKQPVIEK